MDSERKKINYKIKTTTVTGEGAFIPEKTPIPFLKRVRRPAMVIGIASILTITGIRAADRTLLFGSAELASSPRPCSMEMVFISNASGGFCIDAYEASAGRTCPYPIPENQSHTRANINIADCKPVSSAESTPWRFISQSQAQTACAKAGKRLPTSMEWYRASLATPDPDSNSPCNLEKSADAKPALTGAHQGCKSASGAYDMIGNVWEWIDETITDGEYNGRKLPSTGFITESNENGIPIKTDKTASDPNYNRDYLWLTPAGVQGFMRGGYWNNSSDVGIYSVHAGSPPSFSSTGVGFRCVSTPDR